MIIYRYLAREVFRIFTVISLILLLIFLSNQLARYLSMTAAGKLVGMQLIQLIMLEIPQLFSLIFPLAFYLSILLVYGRMCVDSEMVVFRACGVSARQLLQITCVMASLVALPTALFTLTINPIIANTRDHLLTQISATSMLQSLLPGRFQRSSDGNRILYIEKTSPNKQGLENLFIAERSPNNTWTVSTAENGYHMVNQKTKDQFVVVENGYRYEGRPGDKNFTLYHFNQYGMRIEIPGNYIDNSNIDSIPLSRLWHLAFEHKAEANAELQWRISLPLSLFVLALLAFSLSHVAPREGRFARFFPAILLYIIYANFLVVAQNWVSEGVLPPFLGLWVVHLGMLLIGILLYAKQEKVWQRFRLIRLRQRVS